MTVRANLVVLALHGIFGILQQIYRFDLTGPSNVDSSPETLAKK
jgi:hypothetical protein